MKPGDEEKDGPPIHGNTRLEVVWTALPAILILGLCTYAYSVLRQQREDPPPGAVGQRHRAPVRVRVLLPAEPRHAADCVVRAVSAARPAGAAAPSLAGRHPQLVRARVRREDRRGAGHHHRPAGHPDAGRQLPRRVHGAVRRGSRADARLRPRGLPDRVQGVAEFAEAQRTAPGGDASAQAVQPGVPGAGSAPSSSSSSTGASATAAGKAVFAGPAAVAAATPWRPRAPPAPSAPTSPSGWRRLRQPGLDQGPRRVAEPCITTAITKPYAYLPSGYRAGDHAVDLRPDA